ALTPAADRPFVGGSTNNSVLQLAFGYNGLSRITGNGRGRGAPAALRGVQAEVRAARGLRVRVRGPARSDAPLQRLVGNGCRRASWLGKAGLSAMLAAAGLWSFVLLDRSPHWNPWLRFVLATATLAGVAGGSLTRRRLAVPVGSLAIAAALLGPAAYSVQTAF